MAVDAGPVRRAVGLVPRPVRDLIARTRENDVLLLSAGLAFYGLLSLAPFSIVAMWGAGLLVGDDRLREFSRQLAEIAPKGLGLDQALQKVAEIGTTLGVIALVTALWPASSYGSALARALERVAGRDGRRAAVRGRGLMLAAILPFFVLGTLVAAYVGTTLLEGESFAVTAVGWALAFVTGFVVAVVVISTIYGLFPREDLGLRPVVEAAAVAALGIAALSVLFAVFLRLGADFREHYVTSGLAAVVLVGMWLLFANAMLLTGFTLAEERDGARADP